MIEISCPGSATEGRSANSRALHGGKVRKADGKKDSMASRAGHKVAFPPILWPGMSELENVLSLAVMMPKTILLI